MAAALGACAFLLGLGLCIASIRHLHRAQTTVNPLHPETSAALVSTGVRNPIYLGMLGMLLGWAVFLCHPIQLLWLGFFVLYMNAFQIGPEEYFLQQKFGDDFRRYQQRVRRWL
jgi:protein-S-isoprenylcysteine O-methyltransferase Ste14